MGKRRITVRSGKAKGQKLQKLVCEKISETFGIPFDNQDDSCEIHSRESGQSGTDVILRGKAAQVFPFDVECKNTEQWNLPSAIEQAKANTKPGRDWLVVLKKNRVEPIVVLDIDTFFKMAKKYAEE